MIRLSLALRSEQLYCGSHSGQSTTIWTALQILEHWASSEAADEGRESFLRSPCRTRTALPLAGAERAGREIATLAQAGCTFCSGLVRPGQTRI